MTAENAREKLTDEELARLAQLGGSKSLLAAEVLSLRKKVVALETIGIRAEKPRGVCADCGGKVFGCDGFLHDASGWHHPACEVRALYEKKVAALESAGDALAGVGGDCYEHAGNCCSNWCENCRLGMADSAKRTDSIAAWTAAKGEK